MTTELVVVCPYGASGASTRVRVLEWLRHLEVPAEVNSYLDTPDLSAQTVASHPRRWLEAERHLRHLARRTGTERLLLSRMASPFSNGKVEGALLRSAATGIYDFDDALMRQRPGLVQSVWSQRRSWAAAVDSADVVIAGNDYLAEVASTRHAIVTVIPSCVEPADYVVKDDRTIRDVPRAVWLGSPSTEQYVSRIAPALLAEHARSGLRLTVISAGDRPLFGLDAMTDRIPWRPDTFTSEIAAADFGVMPLADGDWERGKCAYKLLQYAAAGLPVIGDPVGANRSALSRLGGLAPQSLHDWGDALEQLIQSSGDELGALGAQAREAVTQHYSFAAWAPIWSRVVLGQG